MQYGFFNSHNGRCSYRLLITSRKLASCYLSLTTFFSEPNAPSLHLFCLLTPNEISHQPPLWKLSIQLVMLFFMFKLYRPSIKKTNNFRNFSWYESNTRWRFSFSVMEIKYIDQWHQNTWKCNLKAFNETLLFNIWSHHHHHQEDQPYVGGVGKNYCNF